jgi:Arc/MetJ-type ribon-helix-helix transcriptional regulator
MKLSVSLPGEEVAFLDAYAEAHALASRSAAVQQAIQALRREELPDAYTRAWDEWQSSEDAQPWDRAVADGL